MKLEQALDDLDVQLIAGCDGIVLSRDAASTLSTAANSVPTCSNGYDRLAAAACGVLDARRDWITACAQLPESAPLGSTQQEAMDRLEIRLDMLDAVVTTCMWIESRTPGEIKTMREWARDHGREHCLPARGVDFTTAEACRVALLPKFHRTKRAAR